MVELKDDFRKILSSEPFVRVIGKYDQINIAKEAIEMIVRGSKHSKVYNFLQQAKL